MKLGISEAARRAGVDRKTLYRMMEKGKISRETEEGKPVIDLSELSRLFPEAATNEGQGHIGRSRGNPQPDTGESQQVIEALKERITSLEAEKVALRRDLDHERNEASATRDRLLALVERHAETVRLLTDQRAQAVPAEPQKRSFWQRLTGQGGHPAKQGLE